jgi:hypothetical protein
MLIPGFVALILFRWIMVLERKISDYQLVIWSAFLSLLIYGGFGWHTGISNLDDIRDSILLPGNLVNILMLSLLLGVVPGLVLRIAFRRNVVRGDSWEAAMREASKTGSWVTVYTSDGYEYMGTLHYSGMKDFSKEVSIRNPILVYRDSKGNLEEEVEFGKEILFSEKDILRMVFFDEV